MLQITIPDKEYWDESKEEFVTIKGQTIALEHSLVSLSKWEAKWHKPFLTGNKTTEETIDYIKCMTLTQNVDPNIYKQLSTDNVKQVNDYIEDPMTATTITEINGGGKGGRSEIVTAELIYYWMIALNIPFECQKWHLNRLLMLVRVCNVKNQPPKKHSQRELLNRNYNLNALRRKQLGTTG